MRAGYCIPNTTGIKIVWHGVTYTTIEDIHFELDVDSAVEPHAQCSADDPKIMWGENDEYADWFYPEVYWEPLLSQEEMDVWANAKNWQDRIAGVLLPEAMPEGRNL